MVARQEMVAVIISVNDIELLCRGRSDQISSTRGWQFYPYSPFPFRTLPLSSFISSFIDYAFSCVSGTPCDWKCAYGWFGVWVYFKFCLPMRSGAPRRSEFKALQALVPCSTALLVTLPFPPRMTSSDRWRHDRTWDCGHWKMHRYFEQKEYHLMREGHPSFGKEIAPEGFMSYGSLVRSDPAKYFSVVRVTGEWENTDASLFQV